MIDLAVGNLDTFGIRLTDHSAMLNTAPCQGDRPRSRVMITAISSIDFRCATELGHDDHQRPLQESSL